MKNLNELKGVKLLSKNEQKAISGGVACFRPNGSWACGGGCCMGGRCAPAQLC